MKVCAQVGKKKDTTSVCSTITLLLGEGENKLGPTSMSWW
jgi:hypothetical protein